VGWRKKQRKALGDTALITEKRFALSYRSFWNSIIPLAWSYVRRRNLQVDTFVDAPLVSGLNENRGVINELSFKLFAESREKGVPASDLEQEDIDQSIKRALDFIRRFREYSRKPVPWPSLNAIAEARALAERLERFVERFPGFSVVIAPSFPGCGWLDECSGDMLINDVLCEVKSGGSRIRRRVKSGGTPFEGPVTSGGTRFQGRDFRQLLIYAALNFQSRRYDIDSVCLVNPRLGIYLQENLDDLCFELAGAPAIEVFAEIIDFVSQPHWMDEAV
jgi:hypothetical protein